MNISSEYSSGCESGWTLYLNQSFISETQFQRDGGSINYEEKGARDVEEEEEDASEDLSMVSDASSGPPHYHEDDQHNFYENGCPFSSPWASESAKKGKTKKNKMKESCKTERYLYNLDDTASSPVSKARSHNRKILNISRNEAFMENVTGYSQSLSATHLKGKSALDNHFSLLQSSIAKNPASKGPGDFQGRNWE